MSSIDFIQVRIRPYYTAKPNRIIREAKITVKASGKDEYTITALIDNSDFQSSFDWMMDRMRKEVKNAFNS